MLHETIRWHLNKCKTCNQNELLSDHQRNTKTTPTLVKLIVLL